MIDRPQVNLVAAVGPGGTIGPADGLPSMIDKDEAIDFQNWFLDMTRGGIIILGKRSEGWLHERGFYGLPDEWCIETWERQDPDEFMTALKERNKPIFISGGLRTYETFMPYVTQFFIRRVAMHSPYENYLPPLFGRLQ